MLYHNIMENGDRLTREEFERRYATLPHIKKAELIEGIVFMPSPVRNLHSHAHACMITWLGTYSFSTPGTFLNDNATVRLDSDNEVQPDALLRFDEKHGGNSHISEDGYIEGAPELIAEIAASSASYDLHDKKKIYQRNKVREYIVWRVYENRIDWFEYRKGRYAPLVPDAEGVIHSRMFPGLRLWVDAMLGGDMAEVIRKLKN